MVGVNYTDTTLDNKYRILQKIGEGGMGAVYLAQHTIIDKEVAVKFLHSIFSDQTVAVKRFIREAKAAASIRHPNIIDVMDVGASPQGEFFMVMEYLEGESLGSFLARSGSIDLPAACAIIEPTLSALKAAHESEVVHRDLKTDNVFLLQDSNKSWTVKLIDFGVSKVAGLEDEIRLTQGGTVLGTPAYMSPEQARGQDVDHRADLWAVGVILFELLTGDLPFDGNKYSDLVVNILGEEPRSPYSLNPDFPVEAEPVIQKALAKNPDERFQSAEEFLEALRELSSFERRETRFLSYASAPFEKMVAGGDLGPKISSAAYGETPAELMARLSSSPDLAFGDWVATSPPRKNPNWAIVAILCTVFILVSSGLAYFWKTGRFSTPPPTSSVDLPVARPPVVPERVRITIEGAPAEARVVFDGRLQTENPFDVKSSDQLTELQVKAEGFITYETQIVPSEDKLVMAKLLRAPKSKKVETLNAKPFKATGQKTQFRRGDRIDADDQASFIRGGRGTEIAEEFE